MQFSPQSPERQQCPVCRAEIKSASAVCDECGAHLSRTPAQEIENVHYLLSELERWEADGLISSAQANDLRESYEQRRETLRAQLSANGSKVKGTETPQEIQNLEHENEGRKGELTATTTTAPAYASPAIAPPRGADTKSAPRQKSRRALLETLTDPHTIRILLYTGAAMLVVGIIIWLRDVLYLKLREPVVQAALLAIVTVSVTVAGWLTILKTRLRLTGRALTLVGSLLVPVNFWFLERSGLLQHGQRAWLVCAICALLYAHTAAILREKLYVYLASVATIATLWTLIYRYDHEAFGLYALSLTTISLVFLHLSRLLPLTSKNDGQMKDNQQSLPVSRLGYELWGAPLVHVALAGAGVSALLYMLLRLGASPSDELFRLRLNDYTSSIAMLLFASGAYIAWFTGWRVYTTRRTLLYTTGALALLWIEFLCLDGLRLPGANRLVILAVTTLIVALSASIVRDQALVLALHYACLFVSIALALAAYDFTGVEIYTSLTALLLLVVAYLSELRGRSEATARDDGLLFWAGSILLAGPLLIRALQIRLLFDLPAPGRDLATLCASLGLVLFGVMSRLRAPVLVGTVSLGLELAALALTSIDWLQVPLKIYLISTGALISLIFGLLEFRREQILLMRKRFQERREYARERFGEWR